MALDDTVLEAVPASKAKLAEPAGAPVLVVEAASLVGVLRFLRDEPGQGYNMLVDITAVDRSAGEGRFHLVYVLRSLRHRRLLIVRTAVDSSSPRVPSATGLWKSAGWAEREVWDMFGIRFEGHPDLRRILMYEEFAGHPLRKDYPVAKRQPLVEERDPIADPWPSKDGY